MYSGGATRALPRVGFPIRTSRHHWLVSTSTGLIAAAHVLHRLLAPRHPPCALSFLIRKNTCVATMEFSRCTRAGAHRNRRLMQRSLKTQQREERRGRRCSRRPGFRTNPKIHQRSGSLRSKSSGFPRKEVIQPQLPLRLPCYDFTPVTDPTFDGSLPCGLGHRLRVLPASVV
jgi:hypothetical protein